MGRKENWYRHLRHEAERVLKEYAYLKHLPAVDAISLPIPLNAITYDVFEFDYLHTDTLEDHTSGFADFQQRLIRINTRDRTVGHQHYTWGHEIGHVRLHRRDGLPQVYRCTRD